MDALTKAKALATALQGRWPDRPFEALAEFRDGVNRAGHDEAIHVAELAAKVLILRDAPGWQTYDDREGW